jgi:hypothetical protein
MDNFLAQLTSISWWLSVVTVGFLINILSVYITRRLDSRLSRASSWWRKRSEEKAARRKQDLAHLQENPLNLTIFALAELRGRIRALTMLVLGFAAASLGLLVRLVDERFAHAPAVIFLILKIGPLFLVALSFALFTTLIFSANYKENLISELTDSENNKADGLSGSDAE